MSEQLSRVGEHAVVINEETGAEIPVVVVEETAATILFRVVGTDDLIKIAKSLH